LTGTICVSSTGTTNGRPPSNHNGASKNANAHRRQQGSPLVAGQLAVDETIELGVVIVGLIGHGMFRR
jgi:hypothetical protein